MPDREKILLMTSQVAGLGDVFFASPFLRALRPMARVSFLTSAAAAEAARPYAGFYERLHLYSPAGRSRLLRELRRERFDRVICLSEALSSLWIARRAGGARTFGFDWGGRGFWLDSPVPYAKPERERIWRQYGALARAAGVPCYAPETWFPVDPSARERAAAWLGERGPVFAKRPFVAVHPGAGEPAKRWPADRYAEVVRRLAAERGLPVVVVGGEAEREAAARLPVHPLVADAVGRLALPDTAAVLERAAHFVGNDGGVLHLAAALGRPMTALFRSVNFGKAAPEHAGAEALLARRGRKPSPRIGDLSLDEVWESVDRRCASLRRR